MSDFTNIASTRRDADSPVNESLIDDAIENTEYNRERALRCGTHGTGARMALARGTVTFAATGLGADHLFSGTITFSSDADDGDPNFSAAPRAYLALEEVTTGGYDAWSNTIHPKYIAMQAGGISATQLFWEVQFENPGASDDISGIVHWEAIGPVTSGE
jgi:hypothetical protein